MDLVVVELGLNLLILLSVFGMISIIGNILEFIEERKKGKKER